MTDAAKKGKPYDIMRNGGANNVEQLWAELFREINSESEKVGGSTSPPLPFRPNMVTVLFPFLAPMREVRAPIIGNEMLFGCRVPRYHPWIWNNIQKVFKIDPDVPLEDRHIVIYLGRSGNSRNVVNQQALLAAAQRVLDKKNKQIRVS